MTDEQLAAAAADYARLARSVAAQPMTGTGQTTEASAHEAPTDVMATHRPEE